MSSEIKVRMTEKEFHEITGGRRHFEDGTSLPYETMEDVHNAYGKMKKVIADAEFGYFYLLNTETSDCSKYFENMIVRETDAVEKMKLLKAKYLALKEIRERCLRYLVSDLVEPVSAK